MDTLKKIREHISTLSDGELPSGEVELAFAALQTPDGQQAWETYHRIGDVLRAQATPELSDGFSARLAARLAAEPVHRRAPRSPADNAGKRSAGANPGNVADRPAAALAAGSVAAPAAGDVRVTGELSDSQAVAHAKPAVVRVS